MKTIAVGSGKGGVGKTTLTSNVAIAAALRGQRVLALDADYGLANLHLHLGLYGSRNIENVLMGECTLEQALQRHSSGLNLLAGSSGSAKMANITPEMAQEALRQFDALEAMTDVLFVDVSAGIHETALNNLAAADVAMIVVTPDPSSFVDAFATVKMLEREPKRGEITIVINQAESESAAKLLFARFQSVVKDKTGLTLQYQGFLPRDKDLMRTGTSPRPIVETHPHHPASRAAFQIASSLLDLGDVRGDRSRGFLSRLFSRVVEGRQYAA